MTYEAVIRLLGDFWCFQSQPLTLSACHGLQVVIDRLQKHHLYRDEIHPRDAPRHSPRDLYRRGGWGGIPPLFSIRSREKSRVIF